VRVCVCVNVCVCVCVCLQVLGCAACICWLDAWHVQMHFNVLSVVVISAVRGVCARVCVCVCVCVCCVCVFVCVCVCR